MNSDFGQAASVKLTVKGTDAIYLAGRNDVVIPPVNQPFSVLGRHSGNTPEELQESFPKFIAVSSGQKFTFHAAGCVDYFNGFGCPSRGYSPDGNGDSGSNLSNLAGISGYIGPEGSFVGVFLTDNNPASSLPPSTLNFTPASLGINFLSLSPEIGQVFFIGNGVTNDNTPQVFIAPPGATRLFLGIADGGSLGAFDGAPGAYDDNDGEFIVDINSVPEPLTILAPLTILKLLIIFGFATVLGFGLLLKLEQTRSKNKF
ncbi:hypothetical protein MC7420_1920 [Coleofasciculus chthonoplastes PCC 7420]|uniref:DUF4114 domain-containing protein n=1 Tax=Coleofasciculus chthonoplastes PCC 7420 TaxID=118168 RepID=B4VN23_9CYAN|nr:hypothetical protein [Coleofasciculus chthonoplastes]EDX76917.1 hypothetical protein MC7420_1920 [Coleofasciculus chthonoplastes PCC 7420]